MSIEDEIEELRHRVEALEQLVRAILSRIPEVRIECSVPKIIYERRYEYIKVPEDELYGRIVRLALEGFLDEWRSASDVASELLRRGWAPKDFKHVRPALEHLTTLEVLERERRPGRRAKWLYRKTDKLGERIKIVDRSEEQPTGSTKSLGPPSPLPQGLPSRRSSATVQAPRSSSDTSHLLEAPMSAGIYRRGALPQASPLP